MFSQSFIFVLAIGLVHGDVCSYVLTRNCGQVQRETDCGTNGYTYNNNCFVTKAYCADKTIHKAHEGACATPNTTPATIDGGQVALDIFCLDLIYIKCLVDGTQICGSDGKFNENICEFDKAHCFHRDLQDNGTNCCGPFSYPGINISSLVPRIISDRKTCPLKGDCWTGEQCYQCFKLPTWKVENIKDIPVRCANCEISGLAISDNECNCRHNGG